MCTNKMSATMEGLDMTAENLLLDMRKKGRHQFPKKALKRIGISLLHLHEHGIGSRWKLFFMRHWLDACRGKRAMSSTEVCKIGLWDKASLRKALKHVPEHSMAHDLLKRLLHHDPTKLISSMRHVSEHPFFTHASVDGNGRGDHLSPANNTFSSSPTSANSRSSTSRNRGPGPHMNGIKPVSHF
jgi:hypothetical protein